jgi:hypothetical protein
MHQPPTYARAESALLRLVWAFVAPAALALSTMALALDRTEVTSARTVFWVAASAMPLARGLDILRFGGTTRDGSPATRDDLRRYVIGIVLLAPALWFGAHLLRSYVG